MFGSAGEQTTLESIVEFASSANALDVMVNALPDAVPPLSGIRNIVRCAMQIDPQVRQLTLKSAAGAD